MNRKIFTLFLGALILAGSVFTVNAQTLRVPYTPKTGVAQVNFQDMLSADLIDYLPKNYTDYYFLLSVTGIANTSSSPQWIQDLATSLSNNYPSSDSTLVISIDNVGTESKYLRLEYLAKMDTAKRYDFWGSYKFGTLRNSLWCLNYFTNGVDGSNMVYDFTQMNTGIKLLAPSIYDADRVAPFVHVWDEAHDGNQFFVNDINSLDPRLMVGGWHFSQTYTSTQPIQKNMPLYSYVTRDTVAVLVLNHTKTYDTGSTGSGGYTVSVKHVAINDLIMDAIGNVRIAGTNVVENVLLFSLKKVNKFVMNANDWNAISNTNYFGLSFDPDANVLTTNRRNNSSYYNPFIPNNTNQNYGRLAAFEVTDSLYHYGYMQFARRNNTTSTISPTSGNYLYVDTAWVNYGNNQYVAFAWGPRRNYTELSAAETGWLKWGDSFTPSVDNFTCVKTVNGVLDPVPYMTATCVEPPDGVYWRMDSIVWAIFDTILLQLNAANPGSNFTMSNLTFTSGGVTSMSNEATGISYVLSADMIDLYNAIAAEAVGLGYVLTMSALAPGPSGFTWNYGDYADPGMFNGGWGFKAGIDYVMRTSPWTRNFTFQMAVAASYQSDSVNFILAYMKDSIMENQSKFRVVYDPTADSTFINVYQSRVQYPDYSNGSQNATYPAWWTNSFGPKRWNNNLITNLYGAGAVDTFITRPSDVYTGTPYGLPAMTLGSLPLRIDEAAYWYKNNLNIPLSASNQPIVWTRAESGLANAFRDFYVEGHGIGTTTGTRYAQGQANNSIFNFHSFMEFYPQSTIPGIDRVLISTADTVGIHKEFYNPTTPNPGAWTQTTENFGALSHTYGWSLTSPGNIMTYRDSLLYVDIQSLDGNNTRIVTLNQSYKNGGYGLNTKIGIQFGTKCIGEVDGPRTMENDLYLIRNTLGQYLAVPLWSITDSIYWVTPEANEDLTKIPSYQWAVMTIRTSPGSPFRLVNREFENVAIPLMYVYDYDRRFNISGPYANASFNTRLVNSGTTPKAQALAWGSIPTADFSDNVEAKFPLGDYTFIRLGADVKNKQLLGYKYIDKDSTYIDVYAFKFLHWQRKNVPVYLSWDGYNSDDTVLYAMGEDYYDKLFFSLQEMTVEDINPLANAGNKFNGRMELNAYSVANNTRLNWEFRTLYQELTSKAHNYTNVLDDIILERYGFWEPNTGIEDLKPMARQAYRLYLQDYYRWHPTEKGHYVTVGLYDRYVLSDKANATRPYQASSHSIVNLFGVPYFYFRETFFDVYSKGDDYFAMVQRIDTLRRDVNPSNTFYYSWGLPQFEDIYNYMVMVYGSTVANKVKDQIRINREFGLAVLDIDPAWLRAKFVLRGDASTNTNISAFQLERDEDPIYRRFHVNEPNEQFGGPDWAGKDVPDTLEFHLLNQGERGYKLFENAGNYLDADNKSDLFGADGGRIYNRDKDGRGDYYTDTLGHVISFLGMNNSDEFPNTNRAFFVDTAYINRGTGWIKPQYLMAVDPYNPIEEGDCDPKLGGWYDTPNRPYVLARYLYNTAQYSKAVKMEVMNPDPNYFGWPDYTNEYYSWVSNLWVAGGKDSVFKFTTWNFNKVEPIEETILRKPNGAAYTYDDKWERLAFAWAIHNGDSLYVLKGTELEPGYKKDWTLDPQRLYQDLVNQYGGVIGTQVYLDFPKLVNDNITGTFLETYSPLGDRGGEIARVYHTFRTNAELAADGKTIGLHAIINLADNTHKDWVFSYRYIERGSSDFVIESETSKRDMRFAAIIRPGAGGWIKSQNGVPVITRSDEKDNMGQAGGSVMNVKQLTNPVSNDRILKANNTIDVIGGVGAVTIQNAAGKKVVISNMLGQTVANVRLISDNTSIPVPAGVMVVTVEGESAAKVIVR